MGTVLCYGDSNTWGFDPRSFFGEPYPENVRWTGVLRRDSGWDVQNCGMNGREIPCTPFTAGEAVRLAERYSDAPQPVWLWGMLGTNDLLSGGDMYAEDVAERMERFLRGLLSAPAFASGGVRLRLIAPPPMSVGSWTDERAIAESRRLAPLYAALAESLGVAFTDAGEVPLLFDGVHFSERGHLLLAQRLLSVLTESEK